LTLTEIVVASGLLAIAILPILKGLTTTQLNSTLIEQKTRSLMLAQSKLDEIRARTVYDYDSSLAETGVSLDGSYLCNVAANAADPLRTVTISVGYDTNGGGTLTTGEIDVTLTTMIARRD